MEMVNIKINGVDVQAPAGSTIIEAAHFAGIDIPSLCYLRGLNEIGACRICVVEVKGVRNLVASCVYPINEGMEVFTNSPKVRASRKMTLEMILSNHRMECLTCSRSGDCELQALAKEFGIEKVRFGGEMKPDIEASALHLVRDNSKCVLCRRCVAACANQGIGVIGANERGFRTYIGSPYGRDLNETACISCGQCIVACPTGALREKDDTQAVWDAISDPSKHVVVGTAPSVRATLGECFGMPIGTDVEGKMVAALRRLGFDNVFDVDTAADFTIIEEGNELLQRIKNGGKLPMITSCSPGWIRYAEQYHPDFLDNLSTCKSPQGMFGGLMKTYYAEKMGWDPKDVFVVSIMPCTAKKYEVKRPDMQAAEGYNDIDISLTTRELADMIKLAGLRFTDLPDEKFDSAFGISTGASTIFGATGGVMEAALRTVASLMLGGDDKAPLEFHEVRGMNNVKEATYELPGKTVRVAVVSGTKNAGELLDAVRDGKCDYDFIEVMCCPGGCINGGGQPYQPASVRGFTDIRTLRANALYANDEANAIRRSHLNPIVTEVYESYLGEWGGHKAHHILHTSYRAQPKYRV
ncbi:MAG: (2Fe-2S)-binding protein [Oscillospiraceae bacterium]|nr:(2Fe-2S)-binding protein [Oscillospiraceae bacterium]